MGDSQGVKVEVLPTSRRGFVRYTDLVRGAVGGSGSHLQVLAALGGALVAQLGGRPVALPFCALIDVLIDDGRTEFGRVRYVGSDGLVAVHFGCDPLNHVWEFPADRCRATTVRGTLALAAIRAHLASGPEVTADLDAAEASDPETALHVEAA